MLDDGAASLHFPGVVGVGSGFGVLQPVGTFIVEGHRTVHDEESRCDLRGGAGGTD